MAGMEAYVYLVYLLGAAAVARHIYNDYMERDCPHCKKKVPKAASACSYCGRDIPVIKVWGER